MYIHIYIALEHTFIDLISFVLIDELLLELVPVHVYILNTCNIMCIIQVGDLRSVCALENKKSKLQARQETTDSCEYMFDLLDMASPVKALYM